MIAEIAKTLIIPLTVLATQQDLSAGISQSELQSRAPEAPAHLIQLGVIAALPDGLIIPGPEIIEARRAKKSSPPDGTTPSRLKTVSFLYSETR